jgi:hypothetical protein
MTEILEAGSFMRRVRSLLRVGEFSRERLNIMRIEVKKNEAECEWLTRPPDVWDLGLPVHVGERNFAQQALQDALSMRELLFDTFTNVRCAELRAYKQRENDVPELVLTGTVYRNDEEPARTVSTAMRAKLLGFRFSLTDGVLVRLVSDCSPAMTVGFGSSPKTI